MTGAPELEHHATLWRAARLMLSCALTYGAVRLIGLREGFWGLVTAVVVLQPGFGDTLVAGRNRVAGTLIGAAVGGAVLQAVADGWPVQPLFWAALVPLALLTGAYPNLRLSCVTLIVVVLVPSAGAPVMRPLSRVAEILLGTVASVLVAAVVKPRRAESGENEFFLRKKN